jgi:UDPglucose 6-dehydrogenase
LSDRITLKTSALAALEGADALVIATEWPEFRKISPEEIASAMNTPLIIDQNKFLGHTLDHALSRYVTLGRVNAAKR